MRIIPKGADVKFVHMHFDGRDYYFIEQNGYDLAWVPNVDWVMDVLKRLAGCLIELHHGLGESCIIVKREDETVYLNDDPMADAITLTTPKAGQPAQLFWKCTDCSKRNSQDCDQPQGSTRIELFRNSGMKAWERKQGLVLGVRR